MILDWRWGAEIRKKGDEGFNNAGILTFNSHVINSFIRELFQNSNDAIEDGKNKISISIEYKKINKKEVPDFKNYVKIFDAVKKSHPNQTKFFKKADLMLSMEEIPFLVYSDFNTKGLTGKEDESYSSFVACVLSEGISAKSNESAGGSYGIGKNAIYGVSSLRTVLYSSMDAAKNVIFQGVAKLASYKMNGNNHEGRIYLGHGDEKISIRNDKDIPIIFKRTKPGLSQYVMGVELEDSWVEDFSKAILRNYWMLLVEDGLEVDLKSDGVTILKIEKANVQELLETLFKDKIEEFSLKPYGNPFLFYDAFITGEKKEMDIPHLGMCTLYYKESEEGENNIAYIRNGMVVYSNIEKRLVGANVTGVFKCDNKDGNEILRKMEPPKHDSFEPQMLDENHDDYSKKDGEKILSSIKNSIRSLIKTIIEKYKKEIETPPFLTELFEDLQKSIAKGIKGKRINEKSESETIYRKAVEEEIYLTLASESENEFINSSIGKPEKPGGGTLPGSGPTGVKTVRKKGGSGTTGGKSKSGSSFKHQIRSRIFFFKNIQGMNMYKGIIHADEDLGSVELGLTQFGDSGSDVAFIIHSVKNSENSEVLFKDIKDSEGFITEYRIFADIKKGTNSFLFEISDNQKSAFILN
jgi:hypothetical protein